MSGIIGDNTGRGTGLIKAAGGKTVKRHYFEFATRTAGSSGVADQFTFTSAFVPVDPTVNDLLVNWIAPADGANRAFANVGLEFNDGSTDYDYPVQILHTVHSGHTVDGGQFNIAAGTIPAGTYTVKVKTYYTGSEPDQWNLNSTDDASYSTQTKSSLLITEYKN